MKIFPGWKKFRNVHVIESDQKWRGEKIGDCRLSFQYSRVNERLLTDEMKPILFDCTRFCEILF